MKQKQLGNSELQVSELCLGTMTFGEQNNEAEAHAQLNFAQQHGINFIDTAEMYPVAPKAETQGRTEAYIGSWLTHQPRDQWVLASKITGPARGFNWIRQGPRINRQHILAAIEGSLQRLQTDYLDLYQIHWPDRYVPMFGGSSYDIQQQREAVPIVEQLAVLAELVQSGKVRYIGLSNETPWGVSEFVRCAEQLNLPKIITIQNAYNLLNRSFESGLSETCYQHQVSLLGYSPLAFGWLSGKYIQNPQAEGRITRYPNFGQRYNKINVPAACQAYLSLAQNIGISPASLALAFARSRWFMGSVIIGATNLPQLAENIASTDIQLSAETLAEIEKIHQRYPNPAP